jgi:monoamine oxidase
LPDKFFELEFKTPDGMESKQFEKVIFALPYTVLRKIKMDIEISEVRKSAIKELSYGEKAKYFLSFNDSTWRNYEYTGSVFCDNIYHQSIDCTRLQDSKAKILRFLSSGEKSAEMFRNKELQKEILLELENQFEGISMTFKSEGPRVLWSEKTQQSNAAFGVGQMAKFYGSELQDEGSVYFIGEHVSRVYQGTMNGAVETAGTIVDKILKQSEK